MRESNLYYPLWRKYLPVLVMKLRNSRYGMKSIQSLKSEFEALGNRPASDYTFNLELRNGKVVNDISGTAVARDLFDVLINNADSKAILNSGSYKLSLGRDYILNITTL